MHQKFMEHGKFCMQDKRLQTKTPIELMNNSIVLKTFHNEYFQKCKENHKEVHAIEYTKRK